MKKIQFLALMALVCLIVAGCSGAPPAEGSKTKAGDYKEQPKGRGTY